MTVWSDIRTAGAHIQTVSENWAQSIRPGEWTMKCVADLDGTLIVLYFIQEQTRVVYSRLSTPDVAR